jgi:SIR2-like domain
MAASRAKPRARATRELQHDRDFFGDPGVAAAISRIARATPLVLFIGAGVSHSRGLPLWASLLRELVRRGAATLTLPPESRQVFEQQLLQTTDPTILGSIIRQFYRPYRSLNGALRSELYTQPDTPLSKAFVRAVCRLILVRHDAGLETLVLTTNYDDVLEQALKEDPYVRAIELSTGRPKPVSVYSETTLASVREGDLAIHHIHGYVPNTENPPPEHDIVLSSRDYATEWGAHWSDTCLSGYWDSQWLFVGMSLHDPHISFTLAKRQRHYKGTARSPIGLFSLQGQPLAGLEDDVTQALVQAELLRLDELGMVAEPTKYFFEDAQFLHEICNKIALPPRKRWRSYDTRQADWARRFWNRHLGAEDSQAWRKFQDSLHTILWNVANELERMSSGFASTRQKHCKVELWCLKPDENALVMLGTSQWPIYDRERAPRFELAANSPTAAVGAFTHGGPYEIEADSGDPSRWRYRLGVAITLPTEPWSGLAVGSLSIATAAEKKASTLRTQHAEVEPRLEEWVTRVQELLDPSMPQLQVGRLSPRT